MYYVVVVIQKSKFDLYNLGGVWWLSSKLQDGSLDN
jgi:hypothetical protein